MTGTRGTIHEGARTVPIEETLGEKVTPALNSSGFNSVTTVPLSVCYGVLNLLVLADTSNLIPYVCHQGIAGEYEGLESTVPSSAISGGSMAVERSYRTM